MRDSEYWRNYELEKDYWWFVGVRDMVERLLDLSRGPGELGKVLDVGCGTGALLEQLEPRARELWGVDASERAIDFCTRRGLDNLLLCDAREIDLPAGGFDVVTAIGVIEHIDDDEAFLEEMGRLLKDGGTLVLLTSSFPWLWSQHDAANHHVRRYYLRGLRRKLERHGFKTLRFSHLNFFLFPALAVAVLGHRLLFGTSAREARRFLPVPPRPIHAFLRWTLRLESRLLVRVPLPWGMSMIGAFRKVS